MAEAAGIALSVLPVVVSVIEHFKDCSRLVSVIRAHEIHLRRFRLKLKTQEVLFRHQCSLMLQRLVGSTVAQDMLSNKEHQAWTDQSLDHKLGVNLQTFKQPCIDTIKEAETLLKELKEIQINATTRDKLKFALLKTSFEERIEELASLNSNLRQFESQITRSESHVSSRTNSGSPKAYKKTLDKAKAVQKASLELYQALNSSCEVHSGHQTNFCLVAQADISSVKTKVRFKLAFSRPRPDDRKPTHMSEEAFVIVESSLHYSAWLASEIQDPSPIACNSRKRAHESRAEFPSKQPKQNEPSQSMVAELPVPATNARNLCLNRNFCNILRAMSQQRYERDTLLGNLQSCGDCEHQVYYPVINTVSHYRARSLEVIMSLIATQQPLGRLSAYEAISIARCIAAAALQYHETPWLKCPWSSREIFFYDSNNHASQICSSLNEPHIRVDMPKEVGSRSAEMVQYLSPDIRKAFFFSLGVLLIELAFSKPLHNLFDRKERARGDSPQIRVSAAHRLAELASSKVSRRYGKVVKKCLGYDFRCKPESASFGFHDENFFDEFYVDIVKQLEELEESLRAFQLND